jgi:hypothetical protein
MIIQSIQNFTNEDYQLAVYLNITRIDTQIRDIYIIIGSLNGKIFYSKDGTASK